MTTRCGISESGEQYGGCGDPIDDDADSVDTRRPDTNVAMGTAERERPGERVAYHRGCYIAEYRAKS